MAKRKTDGAVRHIKDLHSDKGNLRKHGERNIAMIEKSLEALGAARSIVIDEKNVVLAGNGVLEAAGNVGIERVKVVEADGNEIVAVRRRGLSARQKRDLAIADNRTQELSEWNLEALAQLSSDDVQPWFNENEIHGLLEFLPGEAVDFSEPPDSVGENAEELKRFAAERKNHKADLIARGDTERYLVIVFPSRSQKDQILKNLGLPTDERYILSSSIELRIIEKKVAKAERTIKSALPKDAHGG